MSDQTIIVTGAAGSIGTAVCRVLANNGLHVVAVDIAETPLFWLAREFPPPYLFTPVLADVRDGPVIRGLAARYRPRTIVHAAALKHVGMCAANPAEAIKTNVLGTLIAAEAAEFIRARFVLVSTDKAVYPTTLMGATKCVAESIAMGQPNAASVRLVNIWDSAGSLVPLIRKQIAEGGPVTVTDRRMERYFMAADEAAQMIAEAALEFAPAYRLHAPHHLAPQPIIGIIERLMAEAGARLHVMETGPQPGEKLRETLLSAAEEDGKPKRLTPFWRWRVRGLCRMALAGFGDIAERHLFTMASERT